MALPLLISAFSSLFDVHQKLEQAMKSYAVLTRQTERVVSFLKNHPEVRVDWLEYGAGMKEVEGQITSALEEEKDIKTEISAWVEKNFTSHEAQAVKVDLEALGITSLAGAQIPLTAFRNLGNGDFSGLAQRVLSLGFQVDGTTQAIKTLETSQLKTLEKVREVLKGYGAAYAQTIKDLDGLLTANRADPVPKAGFSAGVWVLALTGVWAGFKAWGWYRRREERRFLKEVYAHA